MNIVILINVKIKMLNKLFWRKTALLVSSCSQDPPHGVHRQCNIELSAYSDERKTHRYKFRWSKIENSLIFEYFIREEEDIVLLITLVRKFL